MDIFGQRRGHYAITTVISKYCHYYKVLLATLSKATQTVGSRAMSPDPPDLKALLLFTTLSSIRITQKVYESIGCWAHPEGFWFRFWCRAWECAFLTSSQMMLKLLVWVPCLRTAALQHAAHHLCQCSSRCWMTFCHKGGWRVDSIKHSLMCLPTKRLPESGLWVGRVPKITLGQVGSAQPLRWMSFRAQVSSPLLKATWSHKNSSGCRV